MRGFILGQGLLSFAIPIRCLQFKMDRFQTSLAPKLFKSWLCHSSFFQLAAGRWRLAAEGWPLEAAGWMLEAGSWRLEAGGSPARGKERTAPLCPWTPAFVLKIPPKSAKTARTFQTNRLISNGHVPQQIIMTPTRDRTRPRSRTRTRAS